MRLPGSKCKQGWDGIEPGYDLPNTFVSEVYEQVLCYVEGLLELVCKEDKEEEEEEEDQEEENFGLS